jgi:hypothetical protein
MNNNFANEPIQSCFSHQAAVEPRRAVLEPRRAVLEPSRAEVESRRAAVEPRRAVVEPRRAVVEPRRGDLFMGRAHLPFLFVFPCADETKSDE